MNRLFAISSLVMAISLSGITYAQDRGWATSIAWSPDGKAIAIGSNTGLWFFDTEFAELGYVATPEMGGYPPSTIDWNAKGDLVAMSYSRFTDVPMLIVDVNTQKIITTIKDQWVTSTIRWHPKDDLVMAGTLYGTVHIWDALTSAELFVFEETLSERFTVQNYISAVCWLSENTVAIMAAHETYLVNVPENRTLESLMTSQLSLADCSPDGDILKMGISGAVYHLLLEKSEEIPALYNASGKGANLGVGVAWSPDGSRVALNGLGCNVYVYEFDGQSWELMEQLRGSYSREDTSPRYRDSIAWHPDASRFVAVGQFDIRMWNAETYELLHLFDGFEIGYHETLKSSIGLSKEERKQHMDEKHVKCP